MPHNMLSNLLKMKSEKEIEDFYVRLKDELNQSTKWPSEYLYKFIIPNDSVKKEQLIAIFSKKETQTDYRKSSNGKYLSVSIKVTMLSADEVIQYYKEASNIDGIISL